jgi:hypothetical protein
MTRIAVVSAVVAMAAIFGSAIGMPIYPWKGTTLFALAVAVEATALVRILQPATRQTLGVRALVAAFFSLVALWFSAQDTLGAPEYVFMHQRWLVAIAVGCCAIAAWRGVALLRRRQAQQR